ncbi:MAG: DUF3857 and transglutaminase domain-containing protein [bacterium]
MRYFKWLVIAIIFSLKSISLLADDPNIRLIQKINDKDYSSNTVILYDSTDVDVMDSGLSYVTMHRFIKILNENGAKLNRQMNFDYDPLSAFVEVKFARIYRKDGTIEILDNKRFLDNPAPARAIYWGSRNITIDFGRLEPGDAIETIVFRKGFTYALLYDDDEKFVPPMRGHFYDIVNFWSGVPCLEKVYRIAMPENKPLQYEVYNGEVSSFIHFPKKTSKDIVIDVNPGTKNIKPAALANNSERKDNKIVYCWYKKNIEPFKGEPDMLSASDVSTKLLLSTSENWYAKAVWFNKVNEDFGSFEFTPEIKKMADEITKDSKNELDKISKLNHWVAEEIRYSGISMGEGEGYTLHKGEMTFTDRCGVCKDKAGMLVTMLRAAGFESYPAMTMAGSRIDYIPADQFNHSVTVAKLSNGHWILLDPTWVPGVREEWSSAEQQQQFLMGIPGGSDLMTTPISPPENHFLKMLGESQLLENGALEGKITITAEGQSDAAIRRSFVRSYQSGWKEILPAYLAKINPDVEFKEIKYTDPYDVNLPMKIDIAFKIPDFALITNEQIIFTPLLARNPFNDYTFSSELLVDTSLSERKFGFRIRCSKLVQIEETIKLPKYKSKKIIPEFSTIKGEWDGFSAKYNLDAAKLTLKAEHKLGKRLYDADDWNDFKSALVERNKLMNSVIILNK